MSPSLVSRHTGPGVTILYQRFLVPAGHSYSCIWFWGSALATPFEKVGPAPGMPLGRGSGVQSSGAGLWACLASIPCSGRGCGAPQGQLAVSWPLGSSCWREGDSVGPLCTSLISGSFRPLLPSTVPHLFLLIRLFLWDHEMRDSGRVTLLLRRLLPWRCWLLGTRISRVSSQAVGT